MLEKIIRLSRWALTCNFGHSDVLTFPQHGSRGPVSALDRRRVMVIFLFFKDRCLTPARSPLQPLSPDLPCTFVAYMEAVSCSDIHSGETNHNQPRLGGSCLPTYLTTTLDRHVPWAGRVFVPRRPIVLKHTGRCGQPWPLKQPRPPVCFRKASAGSGRGRASVALETSLAARVS